MNYLFAFLLTVAVCATSALAGPYAEPGIPGFVGSEVNPALVGWASACTDYSPAPGVNAPYQTPEKTLGPVTGVNVDIASLGDLNQDQIGQGLAPGAITLYFDTAIVDGPGPDLAVFENGFGSGGLVFAELAYVDVSSDGETFVRFPSVSLTTAPVGSYGAIDPTGVHNLAGKHPNAGGTSLGTPFDLAELATDSAVLNGALNLNAVRYVRIVDVPGSGDFKDSLGNPIYDAWVTQGSGGFDLEAVGVLNTTPPALGVSPADGYRLERLFDSGDSLRGPEVVDRMGDHLVFYEAFYGLEIVDPATETIVASYGAPTDGYMAEDAHGFVPWVNFVEAEPGGDGIWVGYSVFGNTDDRIYRLDLDDGTWTHQATMPGNCDLEFLGDEPYVSGLNDTDWNAPGSIWKLDVSGANDHDQLIEIGGNASGFGLTPEGDVYCASYSLQGEEKLWRWDATAIAGAVGEGTLTLAEGTLLYDIELGGYDTEMDDMQNAVFSGNETGRGKIYVWPATNAPGEEPLEIASSVGETWLSFLAVAGDMTTNGTAYFVDYYTPGLYALTAENGSGPLAGDLNGDGSVDSGDLDIIRGNWGQAVAPGDPSQGDANEDGVVDSGDLDVVRGNWGAAAAAAVPEPGVAVLLVLGVIGGVAGRRTPGRVSCEK